MSLDKIVERLCNAKKCERCGKDMTAKTLSFINDQVICLECKNAEKEDSLYLKKTREWLDNLKMIYKDVPRKRRTKRFKTL